MVTLIIDGASKGKLEPSRDLCEYASGGLGMVLLEACPREWQWFYVDFFLMAVGLKESIEEKLLNIWKALKLFKKIFLVV